jgi:hypothetical protein
MKLLLAAVASLTLAACASAAPEAPATAPAQAQTADAGLGMYEGSYALEGPGRVIDVRVWVDTQGRLNGELVASGQQTILSPSGEHRFLHAMRDDIWLLFTVENGRATRLTMHQAGREISGPRRP